MVAVQGIQPWLRAALSALVAGLIVGAGGCASYSERLTSARESAAAGNYDQAVQELNRSLDVASAEEFPSDFKEDDALATLERASLLQAMLAFENSTQNLLAADRELELLEFEGDPVGALGRYIYSDSAGVYKLPSSERLALHAVNMLNYLSLDDLTGAGVEARRFTVSREYLVGLEQPTPGDAFGSYFAGLGFERLGDGNRALRYYEEALRDRSLATLKGAVSRLAARHPYRGPGINKLIQGAPAPAGETPSEIVVVMSLGRVPYKIPERIGIHPALAIAGSLVVGDAAVLGHLLLKQIVYPELTPSLSLAQSGSVTIDGQSARVDLLVDLGDVIEREYESLKPHILAAALSRMIVRAAASEGLRQAGSGQSEALGWFVALATEGALLALDTPDTRSWSFLAERVFVSRHTVDPGEHDVQVEIHGAGIIVKRDFRVNVPAGKVAIVVVTEPR